MLRILCVITCVWALSAHAAVEEFSTEDLHTDKAVNPPPPEVRQKMQEMFNEANAEMRQRKEEWAARPIVRRPSVHVPYQLKPLEWSHVVLGRCAGAWDTCEFVEEELRAILLSGCGVYPILLDASMNGDYPDPDQIYGSRNDFIYLSRSLVQSGEYVLMPRQPTSLKDVARLTCEKQGG